MDKRTELLEKFKKVEGELVESLKHTNIDISENNNTKLNKAEIEKYIKQVKNTRKLFDEYESIAIQIEKLAGEKGQKIENSEEIVNLREPEGQEVITQTTIQTEVLPDNNIKITTKKKTKKSVREF